jgi:hypothetical protein
MSEEVKEIKKKLVHNWERVFPSLGVYAQKKLYKVIGPLVVGIELVNIQRIEGYRPHFVIYSLWGNKVGNDVKACLDGPVVLFEIHDRKGLQLNIPYVKHNALFTEAVDNVKKQVSISFDKDLSLKSLFELVNSHLNHFTIKNHAGSKASLYEFKFNVALYVNSTDHIKIVLSEIQRESKGWNMQQFELIYKDYHAWFKGLEEKVAHRDEFIALIQTNKQDKKLVKLPYSELRA